ncbi:MAG: imidazole glycerol phosphate synthase subunit HisH [Sandaracinus sp.]
MSEKVVVLDTGMGNVRSVMHALARAGASPVHTRERAAVLGADRLVVPGQGHFGDCARAFEGRLGDEVRAFLDTGRPYLGICLGMQVLFDESEEAPGLAGLGVIPGRVRRFPAGMHDASGAALKVPHMGWSSVKSTHTFVDDGAWLYFVHSFYCDPADAKDVVVRAEHGVPFAAAVARGNVFGCQFHPEKSQDAGAALLARFLAS